MIALACDHGGYALMQAVKKHLDVLGLPYHDFGTWSEDSCDYPDYAAPAARAVASGATIGSVIGASLTATEAIIETKTIYAPLPRATAPLRQN